MFTQSTAQGNRMYRDKKQEPGLKIEEKINEPLPLGGKFKVMPRHLTGRVK